MSALPEIVAHCTLVPTPSALPGTVLGPPNSPPPQCFFLKACWGTTPDADLWEDASPDAPWLWEDAIFHDCGTRNRVKKVLLSQPTPSPPALSGHWTDPVLLPLPLERPFESRTRYRRRRRRLLGGHTKSIGQRRTLGDPPPPLSVSAASRRLRKTCWDLLRVITLTWAIVCGLAVGSVLGASLLTLVCGALSAPSGPAIYAVYVTQLTASPAEPVTSGPGPPVPLHLGENRVLSHEVGRQHYLCHRWETSVLTSMPHGLSSAIGSPAYVKDPEHGWIYGHAKEFSPEQVLALKTMMAAHRHCFAYSNADLPGYKGLQPPASITLKHDARIYELPRHHASVEKTIEHQKCSDLAANGIITKAPIYANRYAANNTLPGKKDSEGNLTDRRFCTDLRALNEATEPENYRMPLIEDLLRDTGNCKLFTKFDLRAGYHQIPICPEDQHKLAFWWQRELWMYQRMPMGARNSSAVFQRIMDSELAAAGLSGVACAYQDDVLIFGSDPEQHMRDVQGVMECLHRVGLRIHPDKTVIAANSVDFLGHLVSQYGISPSEAKVKAIREMAMPKNLDELRTILGFLNYYRAYVPDYSELTAPLHALTCKGAAWQFGQHEQTALDAVKTALCAEGRAVRRLNPDKPIQVYTDWCCHGIGAVIGQVDDDGHEYMVACISRSLNKHERRYEASKGEMLAVVWALRTFHGFLHGRHFTVVTDHRPLTWMMKNRTLTGQYCRWALICQEYDFEILHRAGKANANADCLSRLPRDTAEDESGARLNFDDDPEPQMPKVTFRAMLDAEYAERANYSYTHLAQLSALLPRPLWEEPYRDPHEAIPQYAGINGIDPTPLPSKSVLQMQHEGVILFEPFGGLCAGLEMCLRNGIRIHRYYYSDKNPACQRVCRARLTKLRLQYPQLLSAWACDFATLLPNNVWDISDDDLQRAAQHSNHQWLVVGGWECQDLSAAGKGRGLAGPRSNTYFALQDIIASLQRALPYGRLGYILENTPMQYTQHPTCKEAFELICTTFGQPVTFDAAQMGSFAHRLRNYWTNLGPQDDLQRALCNAVPPPGHDLTSMLEPGWTPRAVRCNDKFPWFAANKIGQPRAVMPTLMATIGSFAFRNGNAGTLVHSTTGESREPLVQERERFLGYGTDATEAPGGYPVD